MRVGIIALLHESNTFISQPTTLEHFRQNLLVTGDAVRQRMTGTHHEVGGFFDALDAADVEAVGIFAARAVPYGAIEKDAFHELVDRMFAELRQAGPLDGLLVAPHGATVSQEPRDADGYWLTRLRQHVGSGVPVIGTLDPHANLSPAMVDACDALVAYRSNPHLDQRQRGGDAARLMIRTLCGQIQPVQAAVFPPVAMNIQCQESTAEPCLSLYRFADQLLSQHNVLSNSVILGFPYADVEEMGSAFITVTDNDPQLAASLSADLGNYLWKNRAQFDPKLVGIDDVLDRVAGATGPVCLLDMGDNVGGGSPADGTLLAHAIHKRRLGSAFVCLFDPESVRHAEAAGTGSRVRLRVGGKTDDRHGPPLEETFTVVGTYDGKFSEPEPRHGGFTNMDQGRTAVVTTETGLTMMLTSRRMPPFSLRQLTSCGVDPTSFQLLVAKGVNAPLAAYAPICRDVIRVDTPGVTTADMRSLEYKDRRRPLFPFERDACWP